jgi:hypothetical protein
MTYSMKVLQGCNRDITGGARFLFNILLEDSRVGLVGCYKSVTRVLQECYKGVTRV